MPPATGIPAAGAGRKGLRAGALGPFSSVVIGLASTAPAFSVASTLGVIVAAGVGLQTPAVMVLAFVPMVLIAYAYRELNAIAADCGTTFVWASRAFGPRAGWMGGWGIIVADVIIMVNLAEIAGRYSFRLVGLDSLADSRAWTTAAGVVWIAAMTAVNYIGITVSAVLQRWLLIIELVVLIAFAGTALVRAYTVNPPGSIHVAASWFDPFRIASTQELTTGVLVAVVAYWGWDVAVSVNEETVDSRHIPGRSAVICTLVLLSVYTLVATSAQAIAGVSTQGSGLANPDHSGDVLSVLGDTVFGSEGAGPYLTRLLILMVVTSTVAATLSTILPTARTVFSMAAHRALPSRLARLHPRFLTPTWSTVGMGVTSIGFLLLLTLVSRNVLADTIEAVGLAIAFYYALTGFACTWVFRRTLTRSTRDFLSRGVVPSLGGLMMLFLFCYAAFDVFAEPDFGTTSVNLPLLGRVGGVSVLGVGALLVGFVLMLVVTRGHTSALRLQRRLMPRDLPPRTAVDVAARYVPADTRSGVGGAWFDVVPLSSARVGLVIGNVLGYGLPAAATMGSLRTSLRALARLDLDPDELLSHLDDLVGKKEHGIEGIGVTCLYAVYDPVTGECRLARAGHSAPAVIRPGDGADGYLELPPGPPLGVGGPPFQSTELHLPEGSLLAFFTDGVVQALDPDITVGRGVLADILAQYQGPLEDLCEQAQSALLAGPVDDDAALLLVRTRRLDPQNVTTWEFPPDPAAVADARAAAAGRLEDWGLDLLSFTTELVVSELVTNVIRYAAGPVRLRLIRDRTLICEVSDTGHTSPHLRHAATDEEGGRGLFIIAQLTQRWGTRFTPTGKTIWVEQAIPSGEDAEPAFDLSAFDAL
ncbi:amino acid permease [Streptomyces sp. NPDC053431]|uniref:amino acid permease n=1 Tax=Streptomyces sp. NPDC053431 TaxID=3365703 RepID=UPI0037CEF17F